MTADAQRRLIDALQVIAPLAQQIERAAQHQREDAAALLEATRAAVAIVRVWGDSEKGQ